MSTYEWERGEFTLPEAAWTPFRAALVEAVNARSALMAEAAAKLHAAVEAKAGTVEDWFLHELAEKELKSLYPYGHSSRFTESERERIAAAVVVTDWEGNVAADRVRKPEKEDFPVHASDASFFGEGEVTVTLDDGSRTAVWDVPQNNRAVDAARKGTLGVAFFSALKAVRWTPGTGGTIHGGDEHSRDSGWGDSPKESFGPDVPATSSAPRF